MDKKMNDIVNFLGILDLGFSFINRIGSVYKYQCDNPNDASILILFNDSGSDTVQIEINYLFNYHNVAPIHLPLERADMLEMNHVVKQTLAYKLVDYQCPGANKILREYKIKNLFTD